MADNHSFSETQRQQLAAEATSLSNGNAEDQAQALNIQWALAETERNETAAR